MWFLDFAAASGTLQHKKCIYFSPAYISTRAFAQRKWCLWRSGWNASVASSPQDPSALQGGEILGGFAATSSSNFLSHVTAEASLATKLVPEDCDVYGTLFTLRLCVNETEWVLIFHYLGYGIVSCHIFVYLVISVFACHTAFVDIYDIHHLQYIFYLLYF